MGNGEVFSPITSSESIYFQGKNYNQIFGNKVRLVAAFAKAEGSFSSTTQISSGTSITWTSTYKEYLDNNLLSKTDNGIPLYTVKQDGWYIAGISTRLVDAQNVGQDILICVSINGSGTWVSAMRSAYRMGGSGAICRYLHKGDTISYTAWRDTTMSTVRYLNGYVKYCGDNF